MHIRTLCLHVQRSSLAFLFLCVSPNYFDVIFDVCNEQICVVNAVSALMYIPVCQQKLKVEL